MIDLLENHYKEKSKPIEKISIHMKMHRENMRRICIEKGNKSRAKLLKTAIEEFNRKGYEYTRVRNIEKTAGFKSSTVRYYFGTKKELYEVVKKVEKEHESA
jgi:AcrR family transcriptional regulator